MFWVVNIKNKIMIDNMSNETLKQNNILIPNQNITMYQFELECSKLNSFIKT